MASQHRFFRAPNRRLVFFLYSHTARACLALNGAHPCAKHYHEKGWVR